MNGNPWTQEHTDTLERMAGRPDREIAQATSQPIWKVREWRRARGLMAYPGDRSHWDRRDWLMADAAGLDFHPALCRP